MKPVKSCSKESFPPMLGMLIRWSIQLSGMVVSGPGVSTPELSAIPAYSLLVTTGSWLVLNTLVPSSWPAAL